MKLSEFANIIAAIIVLAVVISFSFILKGNWARIPELIVFAIIIIAVSVLAKKLMAYALDADIEHKVWGFYRFGFKPHHHFKKEAPFGILVPLFFSVCSLGLLKFMTLLTYETKALRSRVAKRFGYYSYTEMTDWHNGVVGAAGIIAVLILALITYLLPTSGLEYLSKMAAYYAFFNMIPFSNLDGTQILFGSKLLWVTLAIITLVFTIAAIFIQTAI